MNLSRNQALDLLWENPIEVGHWVGFKDLTELHNEWLKDFLWRTDDQTLQGHRGSYKTTTLSLFFALHAIIRPNETIMFFRKTGANEVILTTVNILQSGCVNELVNAIYGKDLKLIKASSFAIETNLRTSVSGSSQITGRGLFGSVTGLHADIVVTDDIVNVQDRISEAERNHTKTVFQELQNIKNRGGRFINTGTPWHKDDCFTLMPNPKRYDCYSTGLMTPEQIQHVKERMTPSLFAANYELRHIAAEDVIFQNPVTGAEPSLAEQGWAHVDAAYWGEDWTALTILAIHDGKFYVFGKCWRKHIDDVMDEIVEWCNMFMPSKLYMERNADKGYAAGKFKEKGLRVSSYDEHQNKYIKIVSHLKFEWPNVVFVKGTDDAYIQQITDYNEHAEHDDCPDSLASLIRRVAKKRGRV